MIDIVAVGAEIIPRAVPEKPLALGRGAVSRVEVVPGVAMFQPAGLQITLFIEVIGLAVDLLQDFDLHAVFIVYAANDKLLPAVLRGLGNEGNFVRHSGIYPLCPICFFVCFVNSDRRNRTAR